MTTFGPIGHTEKLPDIQIPLGTIADIKVVGEGDTLWAYKPTPKKELIKGKKRQGMYSISEGDTLNLPFGGNFHGKPVLPGIYRVKVSKYGLVLERVPLKEESYIKRVFEKVGWRKALKNYGEKANRPMFITVIGKDEIYDPHVSRNNNR